MGRRGGVQLARPSVALTAMEVILISAGLSPGRAAVTVMVPGVRRGADGDAIDAAFGVEVEVVGGVDLAAVVAAAPDGGAGAGEVDAGVVGGAAVALGVDDFEVDQGGVLAVGLAGRGADDGGEFDLRRVRLRVLSCCAATALPAFLPTALRVPGANSMSGKAKIQPLLGLGVTPADLPLTKSSTDCGVGDDVNGFRWSVGWGRSSGRGCGGRAWGSASRGAQSKSPWAGAWRRLCR